MEALIQKGVHGKMLSWINDYLTDRAANVRFQGTMSKSLYFENGTPQGSILSPTLFNLLMEKLVDLPFDPTVYAVSYADDVAIFAADGHGETWQNHIQEALDRMDNACTYWGLKISPTKSKLMPLRHSATPVTRARSTSKGKPLRWQIPSSTSASPSTDR